MANYNSGPWYQGLINNLPPGYPSYLPPQALPKNYAPHQYPPYGPNTYPQDPYFNNFYPRMMMHPSMVPPGYFYADPKNMPKIKYDPKKLGYYQNSYSNQLKPPKANAYGIIDDSTIAKQLDQLPKTTLPNKLMKSDPQKNLLQKNNVKKTTIKVRDQPNSPRSYDSKFNMLMEKQDEIMKKNNKFIDRQGINKLIPLNEKKKGFILKDKNTSDTYFNIGASSRESSIKTVYSTDR